MMCRGWIARLMLVIALLPWGAYHGALRAADLGSVDNASVRGLALHSPPDTAQVVLPGDAANTPALLVAQPRRCKTGVLGGSGCAPDAVMGRTAGSVPPLAGPTGQTAQSRALVSALAQAPPRRPPRAA